MRREMKKRKKLGKTDYRKRKKLLKSGKPRLVVRLTNRYIISQLIRSNSEPDETIVSANSKELEDYGWKVSFKNTPAAYLTGFLCGQKALKNETKEAVLDTGFRSGSRVFAVLKGAIDAGMDIPHNQGAIPNERRVKGKHVQQYAQKLKEEGNLERHFSYFRKGLKPKDFTKHFKKIKRRIEEKWKKEK